MHAYIHPHYAFTRYEEANYRDIPQASPLLRFGLKLTRLIFTGDDHSSRVMRDNAPQMYHFARRNYLGINRDYLGIEEVAR